MIWTELGNLDAEVSTFYKKILEAEVPSDFKGELLEISFYSSRPDISQWRLKIGEEVQFTDKKIYTALTLPYGNKTIHTLQKILVWVKTDGVATDLAASLTGELIYLGCDNRRLVMR